MSKLTTKVLMVNDTPIYINTTQTENVESYTYLEQRRSTRRLTNTRRFKDKSPSTATFSREALEQIEQTSLQLMRTSSNGIWCGHMDIHQPTKEQVSSRTHDDGKEYGRHHKPGQKDIIWVLEKIKVTDATEQVRRRKWV